MFTSEWILQSLQVQTSCSASIDLTRSIAIVAHKRLKSPLGQSWESVRRRRSLVKGIGVDIVKIDRIANILDKSGKAFLKRLFTQGEISHSSKAESEATYFATLFAAKESILKAFGVGWHSAKGTDIEIRRARLGAPIAKLTGDLAKLAKSRSVGEVLVSLSYDSEYAIAVCVLVGIEHENC